jgi:hypothetical protein
VTADTVFWRTLHAGAYDQIPRAMTLLKAAYLQNPRDPRTTAHVGFLHAWAGAERARLASVPPTITDELILARTYFARAAALDPADARVQGFHAVFEMSDAAVQRDSAAFAAGLARGRAAIAAWPEFNWFTVGYTLSGRDHASPLFREGLRMQWQTVDACSGTPVDRAHPTADVVLRAEVGEQDPRRRRACWNSWIAPHNVEGFFLNMGDMLVKSGDWRTAVRVYALAQGWPRTRAGRSATSSRRASRAPRRTSPRSAGPKRPAPTARGSCSAAGSRASPATSSDAGRRARPSAPARPRARPPSAREAVEQPAPPVVGMSVWPHPRVACDEFQEVGAAPPVPRRSEWPTCAPPAPAPAVLASCRTCGRRGRETRRRRPASR